MNNNCQGNCKSCRGNISEVRVFWPNHSFYFGSFNYCESAITRESGKGNIVETGPPPLYSSEERTNCIRLSAT